jgi:DNA polymerase
LITASDVMRPQRGESTAGIDRGAVYVTNAVKHFKWEARGKRRLHKRPNATEIDACSLWLGEEIAHVHPGVVVEMGTTAVRAVLGKTRAIASLRGHVVDPAFGPPMVATVHPSAIVRVPDRDDRRAALEGMVADLRLARELTAPSAKGTRRRPGLTTHSGRCAHHRRVTVDTLRPPGQAR